MEPLLILDWLRQGVIIVMCAVAAVFALAGTCGFLRFPDADTRLNAVGLTGTTAVFRAFLAALAAAPSVMVAARIVVIMLFFLVSNPTTTHIIARYAWKSGLDPWMPAGSGSRRSQHND